MYYVELNAVRANIVERPEEYEGGLIFFREINQDSWMMNIKDIIHAKDKKTALINYKTRIYYRGNVRTKTGQKEISDYIIKQEEAAGFKVQGAYSKRIRYFVDGVAIGSNEYIKDHIKKLKLKSGYLKRQNPITLKDNKISILRPQRNSEVYIN